VKEQLEKLVLQMYRSGMRYFEAVSEFQRIFILTVLREQRSPSSNIRSMSRSNKLATCCWLHIFRIVVFIMLVGVPAKRRCCFSAKVQPNARFSFCRTSANCRSMNEEFPRSLFAVRAPHLAALPATLS
jgi:hypothetical protein